MILCIIQARMTSHRLPGKVLMPIRGGKPMLQYLIDEVALVPTISKLIVATSIEPSDDPIEALCRRIKINCYRGPLNDVLKRFTGAAMQYQADHVVRLTGDCPFNRAYHIHQVIVSHLSGMYDYTRDEGFPDGMDVEVMRAECLYRAEKEAIDPYEREHVTPYLYRHPEIFRIGKFINPMGEQNKIKLSIDTKEEYDRLCM